MKSMVVNAGMALLMYVAAMSTGQAARYENLPDNGIWWNKVEAGRGWNIEVQDTLIAVTHFGYDHARKSTFWTSAAVWDGTGFVAPLFVSDNGQCLGCPYTPPLNRAIGTVRFQFSSPMRGTATYVVDGVTTVIPIERFVFGYDPEPIRSLLGGWTTNFGVRGQYLGEPLVLVETFSDENIQLGVVGTVGGVVSQPAAFAPVSAGSDEIVGISVSTATINTFYRFRRVRLNEWVGFACPYVSISAPPLNCAVPMLGHRWAGLNLLDQTGLLRQAPSGSDKALADAVAQHRDAALHALAEFARSPQTGNDLDQSGSEEYHTLETLTRQLTTVLQRKMPHAQSPVDEPSGLGLRQPGDGPG
jgi:hypothetical protein